MQSVHSTLVRCPERNQFGNISKRKTCSFLDTPWWDGVQWAGQETEEGRAMGKRQKTGKEVDLEGFEKLLGKMEKALSKVLEEAESEGKAEKVRGALFPSQTVCGRSAS